jgi:hypothetical protein
MVDKKGAFGAEGGEGQRAKSKEQRAWGIETLKP